MQVMKQLLNSRILVVDDDHDTRTDFDALFREHGADVYAYGEILDAVRHLEQDPSFDVVIIDYQLGHCTGVDLLEMIKEYNLCTPQTHFICVTACAYDADTSYLLEQGFDAVQSKPVDIHDLTDCVSTFCGTVG